MEQSTGINTRQLRNLAGKYREFLATVSLNSRHKKRHEWPISCGSLQSGQDPFDIIGDDTQELCPHNSPKQIKKALNGFLRILLAESQIEDENVVLESVADALDLSNLEEQFSNLIQGLRDQVQDQTVFVPIEGLDLKIDGLAVGTVELFTRRPGNELDQILEEARDEERLKEDIQDAACYSKVEVIGDDDFARDEAIRRTLEAILILNLYVSSSLHQTNWSSIQVASVVFNQTVAGTGVRKSFEHDRPLKLSGDERDSMVEWGLAELNACYLPGNNSRIAERIRRAVTWYSKAVDASSLEERFVHLSIALESLLIGKEEGESPYATTGSITQKLGERVAFLLGDDFENRQLIERDTKRLYGLRSGIVHRGETISRDALRNMDHLVKNVILTFLRHNFANWEAFREWIAHQRYD